MRRPSTRRTGPWLALLALWPLAPRAGAGEVFPRRNAVVAAVEKAGPGVVNISTEQMMTRRSDPFYGFRDEFADDFFDQFFERFRHPRQFRSQSLGSGVIVDAEGYIVTNEHVVRRASQIHVTLSDGTRYEGRLLSTDSDSDLALVKIDAKKPLPTVAMGRSDDLMIGETVIALGNPFGLESTVTVGVVSATNRSVMLSGQEAYAGLIQSDAAINPGNSGGALVNINGEMIGINVAIYAQAQGIGFAIPADKVRSVLAGLFNYRLIKKTYIGVKAQDVTPDAARKYKLAAQAGALIVAVDPGSPAAKAGFLPGDLIAAVDGQPTGDTITFLKRMLPKESGNKVALTVARAGASRIVEVVVGTVPKPSGAELTRHKLGLSLQPMNADLARSFGLRQPVGLLVSDVEKGGPAEKAGLVQGDILLRIGQFAINSLDQLAILLEQADKADLGLVIVRQQRLYRAVLTTR